jgi:2-polyprenyl-3-methyl-5-hydroxy-6-metoxy-1,4-benzoquinol methylase
MSYYSDVSYANRDPWFMRLYFNRWFKDMKGPILDVGCAAGDFIAVNPKLIEGIDIDEDNLQRAMEKGFNVQKIDIDKGEMSRLPADHYEGVMASQIIEHLNHPLEFLKEIKRILKSGGIAVILTPNIPHDLKNFWHDYTHKHPFTKEALEMIAHDAGFTDITVTEDFLCLPGMGFLMRTFNFSPETIGKFQRMVFIRGRSSILIVKK